MSEASLLWKNSIINIMTTTWVVKNLFATESNQRKRERGHQFKDSRSALFETINPDMVTTNASSIKSRQGSHQATMLTAIYDEIIGPCDRLW